MNKEMQSERETWATLPDVYVRLQKDELGYPPKDWEQLKGEPTGAPDTFRIKSVPHYARGLAWEDEVVTTTSPEGYYPVFKSVLKRSGYSTLRLLINGNEDREKLTEYFIKRDTLVEFDGRLVAIAVPRARLDEVSEYVFEQKEEGRWDSEDGFLIIDDPGEQP